MFWHVMLLVSIEFNSSIPKSYPPLISRFSYTAKSFTKIMRIKKIMAIVKGFDC